ncbi:unnamed protein product [Camellia sinensis]
MSFECYSPIDHSCDAWQADNSIIPCNLVLPSDNRSYFYIKIFAEFSTHDLEDDEQEDGVFLINTLEIVEHEKPFFVPYDQLIDNNTSWSVISTMLSELQIPIHIQPYMVHRISDCAHSMSREDHNKGIRVLPMIVLINIEDYVDQNDDGDDDDDDEDDGVLRESMEMESRQVGASKASVKALETVRVEGGSGFGKSCVVCQEEILVGFQAKRMPCGHVYHGDCIVRWLGASHLCPLCRFEMPI